MVQRVLLIGSKGQLGSQLLEDLPGDVVGITREQLDLAGSRCVIEQVLGELLDRYQPDIVINTAAYTAVDRAESDEALALQVNAWFPGALGALAKEVPVIHFSSDYVFDGLAMRPYTEEDTPNPLSVYGASKWRGEVAVLEANAKATVLRCSWVVGSHGQNFAKTMLRLACEKEVLRVVNDQYGVPTPTPFVSAELNRCLGNSIPAGLFHLVPSGETTWYRYALWIIDRASSHPNWQKQLRLGKDQLIGISSDEYPTIAKRPASSRLDTQKWRNQTGNASLIDWQEAFEPVLKDLLDKKSHAG